MNESELNMLADLGRLAIRFSRDWERTDIGVKEVDEIVERRLSLVSEFRKEVERLDPRLARKVLVGS